MGRSNITGNAIREKSADDMLMPYLGGVERNLFRHNENRQLRRSKGRFLMNHGSGNDEDYIRATSILDMECGEELKWNRDIACIDLVIALTDWITHTGTTRRRRKRSLDKEFGQLTSYRGFSGNSHRQSDLSSYKMPC